jgi:hypothetical protein
MSSVCDEDRELLKLLSLAHQSGKGSRDMVTLLILDDTTAAATKLFEVRREMGVAEDNPYAFPYMQGSKDHVVAWHAMRTCKEADVHVGTGVTELEETFFIHMGL